MSVINWILGKLIDVLNYVIGFLPMSPFHQFIESMQDIPFLGYLNWLIPVGDMIKIGLAWLGVIALFYVYSVIMRWVKLIGG